MGCYKGINIIVPHCSLMAIPTNPGLSEQIEDILRIYGEILGEERGIEPSASEMDIKTYIHEVISETRQLRDSEPLPNE